MVATKSAKGKNAPKSAYTSILPSSIDADMAPGLILMYSCKDRVVVEGRKGQVREEGGSPGRARPPLAQSPLHRLVPPTEDAPSAPGPEVPEEERSPCSPHG